MLVLQLVGVALYGGLPRPRPYDVTIIGRWAGFSLLAPPARHRRLRRGGHGLLARPGRSGTRCVGKVVAAVLVGLFGFSQLYLATFHLFDIATGVSIAVALAVNAFRFFTPNEAFPVAYRRGKTAHLDVSGRRGEALRQAVESQLGLTVLDIKPVGLEGSGGSTPLRLKIAGDPDTYLFGKLYAMSHVRADRWYKLGRTILYGRLEDEAPFQSVRRFVEYEDYTARLLRDIGVPTAAPVRHRRAHARARVPVRHRVLRRRRGDRRRPDRRRRDRPGAHHRPPAVGRRASPTATSSRPT